MILSCRPPYGLRETLTGSLLSRSHLPVVPMVHAKGISCTSEICLVQHANRHWVKGACISFFHIVWRALNIECVRKRRKFHARWYWICFESCLSIQKFTAYGCWNSIRYGRKAGNSGLAMVCSSLTSKAPLTPTVYLLGYFTLRWDLLVPRG